MPPNHIGTLNEKNLHAALKAWYARPGDETEVKLEGYVIDLKRGDLLVEFQTRNFSAMKRKLKQLVETHPIRLVHPIAQEKWIVKLGRTGTKEASRRKSPKRGQWAHLFAELVSFPELMAHPNFSLEIVLTREEEYKRPGRNTGWRRKGWGVDDRRLIEVVDTAVFTTPADFKRFIPAQLATPFTARQLAQAGGYPLPVAQKMFYCLHRMGLLARVGKARQAWLYDWQ